MIKRTGAELEKLRQEAGFKTKSEAAAFLGISRQNYTKWLSGQYTVPISAFKLMKAVILMKKNGIDFKKVLDE